MEVGGRGERKGVIPIETKHRQTLESSRDPAESERTLCRDGRASTGSESQCGLPPSGISSEQHDQNTGAAVGTYHSRGIPCKEI